MKKFLAIVMIAFAFLTTNVVSAQAANHSAASASVSVVESAPTATFPGPVALASPQFGATPQILGNGGVKPFANFTSCYWNIFGQYWCYRYGCTLYELVKYNCYNGWIKINRPIYT